MLKICVWIPMMVIMFIAVSGQTYINPRSTKFHCRDLCSDIDFKNVVFFDNWPVCERGCRFFNIIFLTEHHNVSVTKRACHSSCVEAYEFDDQAQCIAGCDSTLEKMVQSIEQSNSVVIMSDLDIFINPEYPNNNYQYRFLEKQYQQQERDSENMYSLIKRLRNHTKASKFTVLYLFILVIALMFLWIVNILNSPVASDEKPILGQEKEIYHPDMDEDLNETEEVKAVRFLGMEPLLEKLTKV